MHGCNPGWAGWAENEAANPADAIGMACLGYVAPVTLRPQFSTPVKRTHIHLQLYIYTYPMTSQGEIGEMSCAEAIGGFASLSGSRGMLLAGASDSRSQDRWILCADSIQRHALYCVVKRVRRKTPINDLL